MPDPDVLIVGAGPSGAVAAKRLAEEGFRVTVLEQGDWPDYGKARPESADFDITATRDWAWDPNVARRKADYPIDDSESDITALMWNGVGGGTIVYAAQWQRNMPSDFRVRTLDGIADDWPFTYEDLEPYYVRVERDFGDLGRRRRHRVPARRGPAAPGGPARPAGRKVARAHNELGWHWWPAPNAIATAPYGPLNPCVQRGVCLKACKDRAKGTVDITHWPVAQARGVELITRRTVREVTTGADGLATGVVYVDDEGAEHALRAASSSSPPTASARRGCCSSPARPGRPGELVGPRRQAADDAPVRHRGRALRGRARELAGPVGPVAALARVLRDGRVARVRARRQVGPAADRRAALDDDVVPVGRREPIWGPGFHAGFAKRFGRSAMWGIIAEDLPEESNRVVLGDGTDRHGIRGAKIVYRMSENSTRLMHFHEERAAESLQAAGAYETVIAPQIRATGWHLLGTAKMGDGPGDVGRRRLGPHPRRAEPVRLRRRGLADVGGDEPDGDDRRDGAADDRGADRVAGASRRWRHDRGRLRRGRARQARRARRRAHPGRRRHAERERGGRGGRVARRGAHRRARLRRPAGGGARARRRGRPRGRAAEDRDDGPRRLGRADHRGGRRVLPQPRDRASASATRGAARSRSTPTPSRTGRRTDCSRRSRPAARCTGRRPERGADRAGAPLRRGAEGRPAPQGCGRAGVQGACSGVTPMCGNADGGSIVLPSKTALPPGEPS